MMTMDPNDKFDELEITIEEKEEETLKKCNKRAVIDDR